MLTLNFSPFPVLTTERLVLREITHNDIPEVFALRSDARVMQYIGRPMAKTHEDAQKLIDVFMDGLKTNAAVTWGIAQRNDPALIGTIGFWRIQPEHARAEVGYLLHPAHWRKGYLSEAIKAVLIYGFDTMKLHSVEAQLRPDNIASASLLEKHGFVKEGQLRQNFYHNGEFGDTAIYSLLNGSAKAFVD